MALVIAMRKVEARSVEPRVDEVDERVDVPALCGAGRGSAAVALYMPGVRCESMATHMRAARTAGPIVQKILVFFSCTAAEAVRRVVGRGALGGDWGRCSARAPVANSPRTWLVR